MDACLLTSSLGKNPSLEPTKTEENDCIIGASEAVMVGNIGERAVGGRGGGKNVRKHRGRSWGCNARKHRQCYAMQC